MSWTTALLDLYDKNTERAGVAEDWNGKKLVLMPLGYDTMKAQIEITIDDNGGFIEARTLDKSESETIVPYPDRRTSGVKALPLCDSLTYVAGDFVHGITLTLEDVPERKKARTRSDIEKSFPQYSKGLEAWHNFDPQNEQVAAVCRYVMQKTVIADLKSCGVLKPDENGLLTDKIKIEGVSVRKAFVRFRVFSAYNEQAETAVWLNKDVQRSFINYYLSTAKNKDLCFVTGEVELSAKTNPVKIRGEWDTKASLISSNDDTNFTYRGRFQTKDKESGYNEALSIGYRTSQKMHNALKWIIRRQGYARHGVCVVTWERDLKTLPQFHQSTLEMSGLSPVQDEDTDAFADELSQAQEENKDTGYMTAQELNHALDGYSEALSDTSRMCILALDSATPGRLALTYFKELSSSRYLSNIREWQEGCCWIQEYFNSEKKLCRYEGVASIKEIAYAVYGTKQNKRLTLRANTDGKIPMLIAVFNRLGPCIAEGKTIPLDIVKTAVVKASNPSAYESSFQYNRVLHIACSLVKKHYWEKGVNYEMKLEENRTDRSYLYGRLLAVAEKVERSTFDMGETRTTNAERYMPQFSRTPMRTWEIIRKNTQLYLKQLNPGSREYYKNLYGSICTLFEEGAFESKAPLDGRYLLGYDCQREALKYRNKDHMDSDTKTTDTNHEEEN